GWLRIDSVGAGPVPLSRRRFRRSLPFAVYRSPQQRASRSFCREDQKLATVRFEDCETFAVGSSPFAGRESNALAFFFVRKPEDHHGTFCRAGGRAGQESLTAGSWRPPTTEVHGLAPHGQAVRSVSVLRSIHLGKGTRGLSGDRGPDRSDEWREKPSRCGSCSPPATRHYLMRVL